MNMKDKDRHCPGVSFLTDKANRGICGFTLLELLIAITLLIVIIGLAGMAMRLSFRAVASGETKIDAFERLRSSLYIVSSQIQSQIPITEETLAGRKVFFRGDTTSLQFASGYSIWQGTQAYVHVRYQVTKKEDGKLALVATESISGMTASQDVELFRGFDEMTFEYFSRKKDGIEEGEWLEEWQDEKRIPDRIRMRLNDGTAKYVMFLSLRAQRPD